MNAPILLVTDGRRQSAFAGIFGDERNKPCSARVKRREYDGCGRRPSGIARSKKDTL